MLSPPEPLNFAQHLFDINRGRAARIAYVDDRGGLTYGELEERARRFGAALAALGVRREERVLLLMHDAVEWPIAFLGALYAGVVPVAVNTLLTADDYAYMLANSPRRQRSSRRRSRRRSPRHSAAAITKCGTRSSPATAAAKRCRARSRLHRSSQRTRR